VSEGEGLWRKPELRWPIGLFGAAALLLGVGLAVFGPEARPWFVGTFIAAGAWVAFSVWDETRGRAAALHRVRERWLADPTVLAHGDDLHFLEDGQPLFARLAMGSRGPSVTILTPLRETTAAFAIASPHLPAPGFDGLEPPVGGPPLTPLSGLQSLLGGLGKVSGNDPGTLERWMDATLVAALTNALRDHRESFRGLTFDGRFLGVHWVGSPALDPSAARALSAPLWRPFVPRLPAASTALLN
jgi:hypothetical protein